jgi:putative hemolysin
LEIAGLTPVAVSGEMAAYIAAANQIPQTLREIGRLREISFRAAGEGTGKPADLDEFDASYLHLFVWNSAGREIAGAYRMKPVLPGETAPSDLYTSTLFRYDERFVRGLGHALELGRSFVCPAYQRGFTTLLLLWRGIGHWVSANPRHATLFGPVSISDSYSPRARRAVFSYLRGKAWKESGVRGWAQPDWPLDPVISRDASELDDAIGGMPVLLRHYLNLGGKLLGFHVDRKFSNVLDGLIVVDLRQTARKLLDRYLTRQGAEKVLQA